MEMPPLPPGSWLGGEGRAWIGFGATKPCRSLLYSKALASPFCKSTTFLAQIPVMSSRDLDKTQQSGDLRNDEGEAPEVF